MIDYDRLYIPTIYMQVFQIPPSANPTSQFYWDVNQMGKLFAEHVSVSDKPDVQW